MSLPIRVSPQSPKAGPEEGTRALEMRVVRALNRIYPFLNVRRTVIRGEVVPLVNVHVTFQCNQRCPFCQALPSRPSPDPSIETLLSSLERVTRIRPGVKLAITGGEPTLRPDLLELMTSILELDNVRELEVQTNAVAMGRTPDRFELAPDKRLRFLVAFHGSTDSIYDVCTRSKGLLPHAVAGIRHLLSRTIPVELNCVINVANVDHLEQLVEDLIDLFPPPNTPPVHFSLLAMSDHRDVSPLLVRFPRLLESVRRAYDTARRREVRATISLSASHCAVPFCLLDDTMKELSEFPRMYEHEDEPRDEVIKTWWRKNEGCERCAAGSRCLGLPRDYAKRFGFDELEPVERCFGDELWQIDAP